MFREKIERIPELKESWKVGLQALGKNSLKLCPKNNQQCEGSVDIDTHLNAFFPEKYAQASRWDYVIGYNRKIYFIEIHPAKESEVKVVLKN